MKNISIALLILLVASCTTKVANVHRRVSSVTPTILIAGDSNLVGSFGDELHASIQKWNEADVLSIAIGGGNAGYYLQTMSNKCCGYKVRFSEKGSGKVKILGRSGSKNNAQILPEYSGSFWNVIKDKRPSLIVIVLGSNADSLKNFSTLLKKIHEIDDSVPVYWVGPPDDKAIDAFKADRDIQNALNKYPTSPYTFFSSQKVAKKLHPGPADAKKWVSGFIQELKKYLLVTLNLIVSTSCFDRTMPTGRIA